MARLPRIVIPGQPLHVIQRGNNRQKTFFKVEDYQKYLDSLKQSAQEYDCDIHAYVLMTNHVHLLITPKQEESLSTMMQSIGRQYVRYFNRSYKRSGTLWEGRFKSALIDTERYLLTCSRYIELNPVRAGIVKEPEKYRWSSYAANALGYQDTCVTPHPLYLRLGSTGEIRQQAYRALFDEHLDSDALRIIRENTQRNIVIGDSCFQSDIKEKLKRRVMKHGHGGDRKSKRFKTVSSDLTP